MKPLIVALIATVLCGCAAPTAQQIATGFANGYQYGMQQNQVQPISLAPSKRTDYQCVQNCTQANMSYAYCTSKCSY